MCSIIMSTHGAKESQNLRVCPGGVEHFELEFEQGTSKKNLVMPSMSFQVTGFCIQNEFQHGLGALCQAAQLRLKLRHLCWKISGKMLPPISNQIAL